MILKTRLAAALAFGAGLTAAGAALAQTPTGSASPPPASAQPAPPSAQSTPPSSTPSLMPDAATVDASGPDFSEPPYSVDPPPESSSGLYLPAVVLGYAKSAAGCVVVGCDDGPQVGAASGPASPGPAAPPPASPEPPVPH